MKSVSHSKKVLITGIDGFTGLHLEKYLVEKGYSVYGTVVEESETTNYYKCDLRNPQEVESVVKDIEPDYVLHLAAISFVGESNNSLIYDVNLLGTEHLLEALTTLQKKPKKIILASSATVYGNQDADVLDETMCPKPVNHYGHSKLAMEHLAATYYNRLNILITRPFNYTGPGQAEHFVIPKIVKHFKEGKKSIDLGNIDVYREFNDIRFVSEVYSLLMLSESRSTVVNLCSGKTISLREVLNSLEELFGYTIKININPAFVRPNEIVSLSGSPQKLFEIISPKENYDIGLTLKSMCEESF